MYTEGVLDGLLGFDWDVHNVGHIALRGVHPSEVEQTVAHRHVIVPAVRQGEKRWKLFGRTSAGRYLVVVLTIRKRRCRPVTSYPMNIAERKRYGAQIDD